MREKLQFGVVGTGAIAGDMALSLQKSTRCRIVNAVGSSPEKARAFADRWQLPRAAASLKMLSPSSIVTWAPSADLSMPSASTRLKRRRSAS